MERILDKVEKWYPPQPRWLGNDFGCEPFDVLNQMLYEAVRSKPSNTDKAEIIGKLVLIGRTYSAAVERRKTKKAGPDKRQALDVVMEAACAIAISEVEAMLSAVDVDDVLTVERIPEAVKLHLELCHSLKKANQRNNSSLASKYLHFHRPKFFPMVDSYVREGWWWVMDSIKLLKSAGAMDAKDSAEYDNRGWSVFGQVVRYGDWCEKVLSLQARLKQDLGCSVSLRQVDNYLLSIMSLDGKGGWGLPQLTATGCHDWSRSCPRQYPLSRNCATRRELS